MRRAAWAGLVLIAGCEDAPRQLLVQLELEAPLRTALTTVEVARLDARGEQRGSQAVLDLAADYARDGDISFGAVPDPDGRVTLRFRGQGAAGELLLEQVIEARATNAGVTRVNVQLAARCLGVIPCDAETPSCELGKPAADGAMCDAGVVPTPPLSGEEPACQLGTILSCGECDRACNMSHVALATCESSECRGNCEEGYGNCDGDLRGNGCEVNLSSDPDHCGSCARGCPYDVCVRGKCERSCEGDPNPKEPLGSQLILGNRMVGVRVAVLERGVLAGLGVNVRHDASQPDTRFRMGLYNDDGSGRPSTLVGQTAQTSVHALMRDRSGALQECSSRGLEMSVATRPLLEKGDYWLFLIAAGPLDIDSTPQLNVVRWTSRDDIDYATLNQMPNPASEFSPLPRTAPQPSLAVYLVRVPLL